jgi:phosphoribosylanthranilate isomerase
MRVRVKICGITCYEDAMLALDLGADALGFNFYPASPRFIGHDAARDVIRRLPPLVTTVGVFVNVADPDTLEIQARRAGVQVLQLHGDESTDYCERLASWPLIKAVRVDEDGLPENLCDFPVHAILLDAKDERWFGGTGKTFDWKVSCRIDPALKVIIAGGLCAGNVSEAIRYVRPYAVDVCSGVESRPGKKDSAKLSAFMREVIDASRQL